METRRLYYDNAYLTEFEGRVVEKRAGGWIALGQSAFYPTSGGQPYDTGVISWESGEARVVDVEVQDGVVWHRIDGDVDVDTRVLGKIDWERRLDHMQQHAGDHMLAGAAWQTFRAVTIGLHLGKEDSTIDMTLPECRTHLTAEEIYDLETLVNRRVQRDDPIRCWFPYDAELAALPLRKRPTVASHVRVVAMGDYEMVPCGGTHPSTTGQIGPVKILSATPSRGNLRLCFVAGMRAVKYFQSAAKAAGELAAALSAPLAEAPAALIREREENKEHRRSMEERLLTAALTVIRASGQGNLYACHLPFADMGLLTRAAGEIIRAPQAVALLSCPGKEGRALAFARGAAVDQDMAVLLRASGARGGGRRDMAQGSAADDRPLTEAAKILLNHVKA